MNFRIAEAARIEFVEASHWYDSRRAGLGEEFINEVEIAFRECQERPWSCSKMERYRGSRDVRRVIVRRFSYVVIFQIVRGEIYVVSISSSKRRPLYWATRLE